MLTRKSLHRRTFLRGLGTALALPMLDAMVPAFGMAAKIGGPGVKPPVRMAFCYVPNGIDMTRWTPSTQGALTDLPAILEPMAAYKSKMMLLTGLTQNGGRPLGDGAGDHARAASSYLTGVHPKKTSGADIQVGVSVDQLAAQRLGTKTKLPSIELGCEDGRLIGSCDSGYSCAYSNALSWRSPSSPLPPEINPRAVFERLFGADLNEDPATRARRQRYNKSILDAVMEDTKSLEASLGRNDRRKLDEYLYSVRQIEQRIEAAEKESADRAIPEMEKPAGVPVDFADHAKLMYELMAVAFETDSTRVITMMIGREGSGRTYREIGVPEAHHPLSHHRNDPELVAKIAKINRYHVELFASFIDRLAKTPDGDGMLLDHVMITYGSGLADGNRHQHDNLPVMLVGGASGQLQAGRHIVYPKDTPMNNLYVSILDKFGVKNEMLGDAKGELEHLTDLS